MKKYGLAVIIVITFIQTATSTSYPDSHYSFVSTYAEKTNDFEMSLKPEEETYVSYDDVTSSQAEIRRKRKSDGMTSNEQKAQEKRMVLHSCTGGLGECAFKQEPKDYNMPELVDPEIEGVKKLGVLSEYFPGTTPDTFVLERDTAEKNSTKMLKNRNSVITPDYEECTSKSTELCHEDNVLDFEVWSLWTSKFGLWGLDYRSYIIESGRWII